MTESLDLEEGTDWLSGACDLEANKTVLCTYQLRM